MSEIPFAPFRMQPGGMSERPAFPDTAFERARAAAAAVRQTAALARTLAASGRLIDLTGMDGQVGLICANTLDLPPEDGSMMRGELESLLTEVEALAITMRLISR